MNTPAFEKITERINSYRDEAIELQRELTSIPAIDPASGGEGEHKKAGFLTAYLENSLHCDEITVYDAPDKRVPTGHRPNIVAKIKGEDSSRTIWIMSHMDVVPPGDLDKWETEPWTIKVEEDKIYGRGTEDNQQGVVSSLLAAKAFRDEGVTPKYDIGLLLVADEETGSHYGIQYLIQNHPELFRSQDFFIIPDAGNEEGTLVEVAEKSIVWFKFHIQGKQTHGSTPELGINALRAGADLITKLDQLYDLFPDSDPVFEPPISTFEPTKKEANVPNVNTIPGEDIFYLDCRLLPTYNVVTLKANVEKISRAIEERHKVKVAISYEQDLSAPKATPIDAPVVTALIDAIKDVKKVQPIVMGIGGGTVAAFFRQAGFHAVVWATQDETLHEPNEYVRISNIISDAKVFAHVALQD